MESPDQDGVILHTLRLVQSKRLSKNGSLEPEQEDLERETTESRGRPQTLTRIEFRIQQLNNRRLLLQEIQRCKQKEEQNSADDLQTGESVISSDKKMCIALFSIQTFLLNLSLHHPPTSSANPNVMCESRMPMGDSQRFALVLAYHLWVGARALTVVCAHAPNGSSKYSAF